VVPVQVAMTSRQTIPRRRRMLRDLMIQVWIETRVFLREPVVIAFHIGLPLLLLVLLSQVHSNMLALRWTIGVIDIASSSASGRVAAMLERLSPFEVVGGSPGELQDRLSGGSVMAIAVLEHPSGSEALVARVVGDSDAAYLLRMALPEIVRSAAEASLGTQRPALDQRPLGADQHFSKVLLPGVLGMVVASVALFGFGARLAQYRQRGFLARLAVTPLGAAQFLAGQVVHRTAFIIVLIVMLRAVGECLIGVGSSSWMEFLAIASAGAVAFVGLGLLVGGTAPSGEIAAGICHALFFPMLLVSGAFYPTEALPNQLEAIAPVLPMTYLLDGFQRSIAGSGGVVGDVAALLGFGVLFFLVAIYAFRPQT